MLIRKAEPSECERVGEVAVQAFMHSGYGEAHDMAQDEEFQRECREEARQYCQEHPDWVYVAVEDDEIVGFATLEYYPEQQVACIQNSGVLPEYRNRGISTQLVKQTIDELARLGAKHITVHTVHVSAACRVYEKAGFALVKQVQESDSEGGPPGLGSYYEMQL